MKHLIIIGEGQTEQEFCKDVLSPYFLSKKIQIHNPTIKKTGGGIVKWKVLKKQIENHLFQQTDAIVTTFIDYYALPHDYPKWDDAHQNTDKNVRMDILERGMFEDINESLRHRFIPYIQLHEFEGLLFNDIKYFDESFRKEEFTDYEELVNTILGNENSEMINDGVTTAPSKRLLRLIEGYSKVVYGSCIAESIGMEKLKQKNPRFNNWISNLELI